MLMSHGARSLALIGCPNRGASAAPATLVPNASARAVASFLRMDFLRIDFLSVDFLSVDFLSVDFLSVDFLSIDMAHLAVGVDPPARDGVAVLHGERGHIRRAPGRPALGNECLPCR